MDSDNMVDQEVNDNTEWPRRSSRLKTIASIAGVCDKIEEYCVGSANKNLETEGTSKQVDRARVEVRVCEINYPSSKLSAVTRKKNEILRHIEGEYYDENTTRLVKRLEDEYDERLAVFQHACQFEERKINVDAEELNSFIQWKEEKLAHMQEFKGKVHRYLIKVTSSKDMREERSDHIRPEDSISQVSNKTESSSISVILKNKILQEKFKHQTELKMINEASLLKEKEIEAKMEYEKVQLKLKLETDKLRIKCESDALRELEEEYEIRSEMKSEVKNEYGNAPCTVSHPGNYDIIKTQNQLTLSLIKAQAMACLPKNEPEKFSGDDITRYKSFILSFERIIEQRCTNEEDKFYYLLNYTKDQAHELVQSCHTHNAGGGYKAARSLLHKFYGNDYQIASKYLSKLRNWPQVKNDDVVALQEYATYLTSCLKMMENMTPLNQLNNWRDMHEVVMKLPYDLRKQFRKKAASKVKRNQDVTFESLVTFINDQVDVLRFPMLGDISDKRAGEAGSRKYIKPTGRYDSFITSEDIYNDEGVAADSFESDPVSKQCLCCKKMNHTIDRCFFFLAKPLEDRLNFVRKNKLCYGCLATNKHGSRNCPNKIKCRKCEQNHPTSLHRNIEEKDESDAQRESAMSIGDKDGKRRHLCPAVPVVLIGNDGKRMFTYMGLDTFSTANYIDLNLIKKLKIKGNKGKLSIRTMENSLSPIEITSIENLTVCSLDNKVKHTIGKLYAKDNWPFDINDSPKKEDFNKYEEFDNIPFEVIEEKIGILLGICETEIMKPLAIIPTRSGPYASKHLLGWAVNGPTGNYSKTTENCFVTSTTENVSNFDDKINVLFCRDFEDNENSITNSVAENKWLDVVSNNTSLRDGNFEIKLPFKEDQFSLPNNYSHIFYKFKLLMKKLEKDSVLKDDYNKFMNMMIERGFAERVPLRELSESVGNKWFLSHHGVRHKKKHSLRIVFDCSMKYQGICLNDLLLKGPDLANSLVGVLLRFRKETIAISADIEKMFYMIKLPPSDRNYLRFFWLDGAGLPVQYRLTVHVFGAISSPSIANYALRQCAMVHNDVDDETRTAINNNFYVDDLLTTARTVDEGKDLIKRVKNALDKCGFNLTAFTSNSRALVSGFSSEMRSKQLGEVNITHDSLPYERALGLKWNAEKDSLGFTVNVGDHPLTKRGLLSSIFSIYDPLFIVSPAIIRAKRIFQQACCLKLDWDTIIPVELQRQWITWKNDIVNLNSFEIPRCYKTNLNYVDCRIQLHFFSDGSELAYGSVCYLRLYSASTNEVNCSIVVAKVRLTPLDRASLKTIPRIELNAAKLSILLYEQIKDELDVNVDEVYYWTDSTAVLNYLNSETGNFQRFVANRIAYIRSRSDLNQWRFVPGNVNIADILSRGCTVIKFTACEEWFKGPSFLYKTEEFWPKLYEVKDIDSVDVELKKKSFFCDLVSTEMPVEKLFASTSSFNKLKYRVATLNKFKSYLRKENFTAKIEVIDLSGAERSIWRYLQRTNFNESYEMLTKNKIITNKNCLVKLRPFLDDDGIMRVSGRLSNSPESYDTKYPIILPGSSLTVQSFVRDLHGKLGHMGREWMLSELRQRFHIVTGNKLVKYIVKNCIICRKVSQRPCEQLMAELPKERLTADLPPFSSTGTDYFGPFYVSVGRGRTQVKRYGVIFTCLASRATHLEVANTLDTDGFINSLRRFVCRRGTPKIIRSDNGTNLRAGYKDLSDAINTWNKDQIDEFCKVKNIDWKFQPPCASHFGGIFEREIRTVRKILDSMLHEHFNKAKLTDEILLTLFCEIENILNNKPLTVVTTDADDTLPLTPNHLLRLNNGHEFPPGIFKEEDSYTYRRWRRVQGLAEMFWLRWRKEYIPLLRSRQKWIRQRRSLIVGDIVLVTDQLLPRSMWSTGKIVSTKPDEFGNVRRVKVLVSRSKSGKK